MVGGGARRSLKKSREKSELLSLDFGKTELKSLGVTGKRLGEVPPRQKYSAQSEPRGSISAVQRKHKQIPALHEGDPVPRKLANHNGTRGPFNPN